MQDVSNAPIPSLREIVAAVREATAPAPSYEALLAAVQEEAQALYTPADPSKGNGPRSPPDEQLLTLNDLRPYNGHGGSWTWDQIKKLVYGTQIFDEALAGNKSQVIPPPPKWEGFMPERKEKKKKIKVSTK